MNVSPSPIALILAAGKGSRMQSDLPKPLVPFAGKPMLERIGEAFRAAKVEEIVAVIGYKGEEVEAALPDQFRFVWQREPRGTAHAVECAAREIPLEGREVFVFVGDAPLIRPESIRQLLAGHRETGAQCSFLTAEFSVHFPYARVICDRNGKLIKVVEERDASPEEQQVRTYLTSHFLISGTALVRELPQILPHPITGERYLTDLIDRLLIKGETVHYETVDNFRELVGLNTPEELREAENSYRNRS